MPPTTEQQPHENGQPFNEDKLIEGVFGPAMLGPEGHGPEATGLSQDPNKIGEISISGALSTPEPPDGSIVEAKRTNEDAEPRVLDAEQAARKAAEALSSIQHELGNLLQTVTESSRDVENARANLQELLAAARQGSEGRDDVVRYKKLLFNFIERYRSDSNKVKDGYGYISGAGIKGAEQHAEATETNIIQVGMADVEESAQPDLGYARQASTVIASKITELKETLSQNKATEGLPARQDILEAMERIHYADQAADIESGVQHLDGLLGKAQKLFQNISELGQDAEKDLQSIVDQIIDLEPKLQSIKGQIKKRPRYKFK